MAKSKPAGKPAALPAPAAQAGVTSAAELMGSEVEDAEPDEPGAASEVAQPGSSGSLFGNAALVG
ncbi:hypothetical protein ACFQVB_37220 [Paraburkholderia humisilvae]|uniref:hypothetical protein n=1 Tax=Paraburkholderia humisilvae TaxID=627669 RepID=UPI003616BB56